MYQFSMTLRISMPYFTDAVKISSFSRTYGIYTIFQWLSEFHWPIPLMSKLIFQGLMEYQLSKNFRISMTYHTKTTFQELMEFHWPLPLIMTKLQFSRTNGKSSFHAFQKSTDFSSKNVTTSFFQWLMKY